MRSRPELLFAVLLSVAGMAGAETRVEPRLTLSETYSSNIELAPRGEELHEWITEVKPGVSILREGTRLQYAINYDYQALFFAEESDRDDQYHQLNGTGDTEVIEDRVFVEAEARIDQRTIDPANRQAFSNRFDTGNRTDAYIYRISPFLVQPVGSQAVATLRYTWSAVDYRNTDDDAASEQSSVEDSRLDRIDLGLASPTAEGWTWRADYMYNRVDYDEAADFEFERAGAEIGIPFRARQHFLVSAGKESDPEDDRADGGLETSWWSLGWRTAPTSRQTFEARAGDRFYGRSYQFNWQRRGSRADLAVDYSEEPSTSSLLDFDSYSNTPDRIYGFDRIDTTVFVRKRLAGTLSWDTARSNYSLRVYRDERDYDSIDDGEGNELDRDDENVLGFRGNWVWRPFVRTRFQTNAWFERQDLQQGDADTARFSLAVIRDLARNIEGRFEVIRLVKNSEAIPDYRDNSALVGLTWTY